VQVVEREQDRIAGRVAEGGCDGLEQAQAIADGRRLAQQRRHVRVGGGERAQRLRERLVRRDRLLGRAPVQHGRSVGVGGMRELAEQAGLADPRVAADRQQPAVAAGHRGAEPRELGGPPYERAACALRVERAR
jgi:hypothetical protein